MARSARRFYEDERFLITASDIRTPTTFYPVADTVGRLRHDPFYAGVFFAVVLAVGLVVYFDLWYAYEIVAMFLLGAAAVWIGRSVSILQLDARGFPSRVYLGKTATMAKIFEAITEARAAAVAARGGGGGEEEEEDDDDN